MRAVFAHVFYVAALLLFWQINSAQAQSADPFEHGWKLDTAASDLNFMSVKKQVVAETSSFAGFTGVINELGQADIRVFLDTVDTKIDLRNVRMRFLFFESFQYPEAVIKAQLDPELLKDLPQTHNIQISLPFELSIRGVTVKRVARVNVSLVGLDKVVVTSVSPIAFETKDLNLEQGRLKLQETQSVDIAPLGIVSFNFVFNRSKSGTLIDTEDVQVSSAALETTGNMSREACHGRFEILSQTGNIFFAPGRSSLDAKSAPLLENVYDIISRCPGFNVEISGHTDSIGSTEENQIISERRAAAVVNWLQSKGIAADRMRSVGYGETRPFVDNTTKANRARNRRIEFAGIAN